MDHKLHVIYPGAFKPFHDGHWMQIRKYLDLDGYDVDVTVILSSADREGIKAGTSKSFMDKVFASEPKVRVWISPDASPVRAAYRAVENGRGVFAMASSGKGDDKKRVDDFVRYFRTHDTAGGDVVDVPVDYSPIMYGARADGYQGRPVSSTVVRNDIRTDDFASFLTAYKRMLAAGAVSPADIKDYYRALKKDILPLRDSGLYDSAVTEALTVSPGAALNEGGMAGHLPHPYEINDFTFGDLKRLVRDVFEAGVEDITEKLDGQNIFASVDKNGRTVFARNLTDIRGSGMSVGDMAAKWSDKPEVAEAFVTGGRIIDAVFHKVKDRTVFFNRGGGDSDYRVWINCEIINPVNRNVIPYDGVHVYFHDCRIYMTRHLKSDTFEEIKPGPDDRTMEIVNAAAEKVDSASGTNKVVMKQMNDNVKVMNRFVSELNKVAAKGVGYTDPDEITVGDWKKERFARITAGSKIKFIYNYPELRDMLLSRWIDKSKKTSMRDIKRAAAEAMKSAADSGVDQVDKAEMKRRFDMLTDFDKNSAAEAVKKAVDPLDGFFIRFGDEVIRRCSGFVNDKSRADVSRKLKDQIEKTVESIRAEGSSDKISLLNDQLRRLRDAGGVVNATEGIVLKYHGRTIKLTGSFAAVNQILGMRKYDRKK